MKQQTIMTLEAFRGFLKNCGITEETPRREYRYMNLPIGLHNITVQLPDGTTEEGDFMGKEGFAKTWETK